VVQQDSHEPLENSQKRQRRGQKQKQKSIAVPSMSCIRKSFMQRIWYALCLALIAVVPAISRVEERRPIAMGVNGHPFTQPNYMKGDAFVSSGQADGISYTEQLQELHQLHPGRGVTFYYRVDWNCKTNLDAHHRGIVEDFVGNATKFNITILPILIPDIGDTSYNNYTAVFDAAKKSTLPWAEFFVNLVMFRS